MRNLPLQCEAKKYLSSLLNILLHFTLRDHVVFFAKQRQKASRFQFYASADIFWQGFQCNLFCTILSEMLSSATIASGQ